MTGFTLIVDTSQAVVNYVVPLADRNHPEDYFYYLVPERKTKVSFYPGEVTSCMFFVTSLQQPFQLLFVCKLVITLALVGEKSVILKVFILLLFMCYLYYFCYWNVSSDLC